VLRVDTMDNLERERASERKIVTHIKNALKMLPCTLLLSKS
jgi:hypothetical protein